MSGKVMSFLPLLVLPLLLGGWVVVNGTLGTCPMCVTIMDSVTGGGAEKSASAGEAFAPTGEPIYDLSAQTLKGETVSFKQFAGKPILIDFWASWCGPCREQRDILAKMQNKLAGKATVVAVSMDEQASVALTYVKDHGAVGQELHVSNDLVGRFNFNAIPTMVFVGAEGRVHSVESGVHSERAILAKLEKLSTPELARAQ